MTIANRFRLIRQIGEGGMGSVWLATHLGLGIPCAVKFVEGEWRRQPEMVARFEREAKVEAQLRSPHVVHVLDHGVWQGTPYIAMEYMQGESVAQRLDRVGRLDYAATHRLVAHVARALTRAHAIGIVHRDLKPENVYLIPDDDGEIAKVLDFGVAKWSSDWAVNSVTKTGLLVGTPLYMSPEQARGTKEIDFRADLWSLAVIAYQCLTGELPFLSEGLGDLLAKIMFEPLPVPSAIVSTIPPEFDAWWARASSRDVDARFQSAKELADSLAIALGISGAAIVNAAPPGFRETAMSDYGLSVSDGGIPEPPSASLGTIWPFGQTGKLLAGGIIGVVLIASTMSFQKSREDKKSSQTLVTPSAVVAPPVALPDNPTPVPSLAKPEFTFETAPTAPQLANSRAADHESLPKPAEHPDETSRRSHPVRESATPPPTSREKTRDKVPAKPKNVDFGI
jgi:serine/threonine protein kinase